MHDTMIAVDLAKPVLQLHVASMTGHVKDEQLHACEILIANMSHVP